MFYLLCQIRFILIIKRYFHTTVLTRCLCMYELFFSSFCVILFCMCICLHISSVLWSGLVSTEQLSCVMWCVHWGFVWSSAARSLWFCFGISSWCFTDYCSGNGRHVFICYVFTGLTACCAGLIKVWLFCCCCCYSMTSLLFDGALLLGSLGNKS